MPSKRAQIRQADHRSQCRPRGGDVHAELSHPIVVAFGIDEHLLNAPGALVFGRENISMADVAGFGIEEEMFVFAKVLDTRKL